MEIANTPEPPYYAVIFSNFRTEEDPEGYADAAERMQQLAKEQPGYLGFESARDGFGISVSYWKDLESIHHWKQNVEHLAIQQKGMKSWYKAFKTRVAKVERDNGFIKK